MGTRMTTNLGVAIVLGMWLGVAVGQPAAGPADPLAQARSQSSGSPGIGQGVLPGSPPSP